MDMNNLKEQFTNPEDVTDMFSADDIESNKIVAALGTVPFLFWLPLVAAKDSGFGKFYANQGLTLLILGAVAGVASGILAMIPLIGWLLSTVVGLIPTAGFLFAFINAIQGKAKRLPVIGGMINAFK